jgi:hypothetical protein
MRDYEFAKQNGQNHWIQRVLTSTGLKSGFITPARRAATPYVVDCPGLAREPIGDQDFERQLCERRNWCESHCLHDHEIEPIRDDQGRLTGRRFRFANAADAPIFKTSFC